MKVLVFVEGTILMHPDEGSLNKFASYVPIKNAVQKINSWVEQGAEISYLTAQTKFVEIKQIKDVLKKFEFPGELVRARQGAETYKQVVEDIKPNVFIEDDCKSIGETEITTPKLKADLKIHGIIVPEFGGIDQLPDKIEDLAVYGKKDEVVVEN
jgi:hypothetical protein